MASHGAHHPLSPSVHPAHRPPPPSHVQSNGHLQYASQQRQMTAADTLQRVNEVTWLQVGRLAESMGVNSIAVQAYERVLSFSNVSVEALHSIASILRSEDKYDQAIGYIEDILKLEPTNGESWSSLGHCYLMMDELQKAYQAYQSALYNLKDPQEPKLWYGIGILYDRYGSLDHAEEAFSQVMRMAPEFDKANEIYFRLGIIYKQQTKYGESLECFQWIANNPPAPLNQTDILFQIGHVYEQQQDYTSAKNAYRRVLERDPNHAKVLQQLGWLHHQESSDYGAQESAIEFLEKSVNSDQNDAQSWYLLGRCYMSQQKFPKAYEAYQQAVYRDGRNPTFWCSIGVLYYQINQYRDALDAYSRAIRLNPNISEVWYDLGTLYQSCNNQTSDALDAYQRAAELDPNNPHIKSRLNLLKSGHASGPPNSTGIPLSQDGNPPTYEPAAVNGPPQPQWAPTIPPGQMRGPPGAQQGPPGPPPPPNAREWGQRPPMEVHGPPAQGPPPGHPYDPREMPRGPPPPPQGVRPHSPRIDHDRLAEPHRHTPSHRQVSPSPHMRNAVPSAYRQPQGIPGPGPPPAAMPPHQQGPPPPPNRMTNPNYGANPLPPSSSLGTPMQQGLLPPYGRPASPPNARPVVESRPRSPRSGMYAQPPAHHTPYQQHAEPPAQSGMQHGAPPPNNAHYGAEAAGREREREARTPVSSSKRHREWDERDDGANTYKRNANEETRSRLEDPHMIRRGPSPLAVKPPVEPERNDREYGPAPTNAHHASHHGSAVSSPSVARIREEEQRRADGAYMPSAHAHNPAPLNAPAEQAGETLPPLRSQEKPPPPPTPAAPESGKNSAPTSVKAEEPPARVEEKERSPPPQPQEKTEEKDRDGDVRMQVDEPAMRKIDVNEDYDEASEEERPNGSTQPAPTALQPADGGNSSEASPKAAPQPPPNTEGQKVEA